MLTKYFISSFTRAALGQFLSQLAGQLFLHYHRLSVASSRKKVQDTELGVTVSDLLSNGSDDPNDGSEPKGKIAVAYSNVSTEVADSDLTNALNEKKNEDRPSLVLSEKPNAFDRRAALHKEVFARSYPSETPQKFKVRSGVNGAVVVFGALAVGLLVAGSVLPAISFEASGLFAEMMLSDQDTKVYQEEYGVISIAQALVNDASFLDGGRYIFGLWLLAVLIVVTVTVTPVLTVCGLLAQWFYPLQEKSRRKFVFLTDCFHAWLYTEVFFISAVAVVGTFQHSGFSNSLIGQYCEAVGSLIAVTVDAGVLDGQDLDCYVVNASVEIGSLLLLLGAFCTTWLRIFVSSAALQMECSRTKVTTMSASRRVGPTSSFVDEDAKAKAEEIDSPPVVFTDKFRWCVCPTN